MILIVTNRQDQTADFLILELKKRKADYYRFNTEDFPKNVSISWKIGNLGIEGSLITSNRYIPFEDISSIWYRRPVSPVPHYFLDVESQKFALAESLTMLDGLWRTLECFWVSNPDKIRIAENKLLQLKQAKQVGFQIPQTMVSNSPDSALTFFDEQEKDIVYKPLRAGRIDRGKAQNIVFTNPIDENTAKQFINIKYAPSLLQKYVRKKIELRITVIGNNVFAVSIDSQKFPKAKHDWRRALSDGIEHKLYQLPSEIENKCRTLVRDLGLAFGAIDMIVAPDEQFVFLEINPNGQWAWIQQLCPEIPLRESLAEILINGGQ